MTTVATSRKIVTSIMTFELLESTELDYIDFLVYLQGGGGGGPGFLEIAGFAF